MFGSAGRLLKTKNKRGADAIKACGEPRGTKQKTGKGSSGKDEATRSKASVNSHIVGGPGLGRVVLSRATLHRRKDAKLAEPRFTGIIEERGTGRMKVPSRQAHTHPSSPLLKKKKKKKKKKKHFNTIMIQEKK